MSVRKIIMRYLPLYAVAIQFFFFGCDKGGGDPQSSAPDLEKVVFAVVEDTPITAADIKKGLELTVRMEELKTGRQGKPYGHWSNVAAMKMTPGFVYTIALEKDLERRGIVTTPESDAKTLANYNRKLRKKYKNLEEMLVDFGELGSFFKSQFVRESRMNALYAQTPELKVAESDVNRFYVNLSNRVAVCRRIDAQAHKKINKAWNALKMGGAWVDVATNYTEDVILEKTYADNWKDWISIDLAKLQPPELAVQIRELKVGDYTKPIEHEEGLIIVKMIDRDGDFVNLARILVRSAQHIEILDREAAVKQLERERMESFQKRTIAELKKKVKIDYPMGKRFTYKIWDEPLPPEKKGKK